MKKLLVSNVSKNFTRDSEDFAVLDSITFSVEAGKVLAILGKSGSGKTTLLNIVARLEEHTSGSVEYTGGVSYTPQKDLLLPWRTISKNVLLPLEIKKSISVDDAERGRALLEEFELGEFLEAYPHELSGGMRQKVSLVRSLIQDQGLYLFDESLSAIDFDSRLKMVTKIRDHIVNNGKIGVFVTHNIEEAISIADKVVVFGARPAQIIYEADINIPHELRDPVKIRKNPEFQNHFDTLWTVMAKS